ncbi:hypothetical protein VIGAN_02073900 [Vigna angularis var. angularis]|uniref:Transmembrane protein n=1 Tax=Vigna angularis var. angularis TaxID=157739 RepID=A0A0S3RBS5_PHAAN|nr:hypothetical protein VIGAN_02073900 [Vigna angularis var. angularis]
MQVSVTIQSSESLRGVWVGWDLIRVIGTCCMSKGFFSYLCHNHQHTDYIRLSVCAFVFRLSSFFSFSFLFSPVSPFQHGTFLNKYFIFYIHIYVFLFIIFFHFFKYR